MSVTMEGLAGELGVPLRTVEMSVDSLSLLGVADEKLFTTVGLDKVLLTSWAADNVRTRVKEGRVPADWLQEKEG